MDPLQVVVRAWYSDGHAEDVTRWAKFASSEDLVAGVDDGGVVKVAGHGEAAITVLFPIRSPSLRIASPLPNEVDPKVFAQSPRHNFIDELVAQEAGVAQDSAVAAVLRSRVHSPRLSRRHGRSADAGGSAQVRRRA